MSLTVLMRNCAAFVAVLGIVLAINGRLHAQVRFEIRNEAGAATPIAASLNQIIKPVVYIVNPDGSVVPRIQGFEMALTYTTEFLDYNQVSPSTTAWKGLALDSTELRAGAGPEFIDIRELTTGTTGITVGCVFEFQTAAFTLGAGAWPVLALSFKAIKTTPAGTAAKIEFAPSLGTTNPPKEIKNLYNELASGETLAAEVAGLDVTIGGESVYMIAFPQAAVDVDKGSEIVLPIQLHNSPKAVDGFSLGMKHDGAKLELVDVTLAEGITSVTGTDPGQDFLSIDKNPANGPGFTMAMILSASDVSKVLDPLKSPHHILDVKYKAIGGRGTTLVTVAATLGKPIVDVVLDIAGIAQKPLKPVTSPPADQVTITIKEVVATNAPFIRGDVDQNGRITITDATGILNYMFNNANLLPAFLPTADNCLIAFNIDGSTRKVDVGGTLVDMETEGSITVTDAVNLLQYLFNNSGRPPAEPFGTVCKAYTGLANERMRCTQFTCK